MPHPFSSLLEINSLASESPIYNISDAEPFRFPLKICSLASESSIYNIPDAVTLQVPSQNMLPGIGVLNL